MGSRCPAHATLSETEEIQLGRKAAPQLEKQHGGLLPPNDPIATRVRRIGTTFAALSKRKTIPYSYRVLRDDRVLNAFSAPGGAIYFTRKLVRTAANDAELAYVVGHETAHTDHKHLVHSIEKQQEAQNRAQVLSNKIRARTGSDQAGKIAYAGSGLVFAVWARGYSRAQENDADEAGVRWMSRLGYDPRAALSMLRKSGEGPSNDVEKYLSSHPAPDERREKIASLIRRENLLAISRQNNGPRLFDETNGRGAIFAQLPAPAPQDDEPARRDEQNTSSGSSTPVEGSTPTEPTELKSSSNHNTAVRPTSSMATSTISTSEDTAPPHIIFESSPIAPSSNPIGYWFFSFAVIVFGGSLWWWFAAFPKIAPVAKGPNRAWLEIDTLPGHSQRREIGNYLLIGREFPSDLILSDEKVSAMHATLSKSGDAYHLRDLGSTNGTFINGRRTIGITLHRGDHIRIGSTALIFQQRDEV